MLKGTYHDEGLAAVNYLLRNINPNGQFNYYLDPNGTPSIKNYNLLRHAGSIYSVYQWNRVNERSQDSILECAMDFLLGFLKSPLGINYMSCVMVNGSAKLGGAALTLLALTEKYKFAPLKQDLMTMRRLAEFILWMQDPSGCYLSKSHFGEGQFDKFKSLYYPGEAMLALFRLYKLDPDPRWLISVTDGADYLLLNPVMRGKIREHNHWFACLLAELYLVIPKRDYYDEFWAIVDTIIEYVPKRIEQAYTTAGIATMGEAVVAGLVLEIQLGNYKRIPQLQDALREVMDYILQFQVKRISSKNVLAEGGIMKKMDNAAIRIDYVQHTIQVITGIISASKFSHMSANIVNATH